MTGHPINLHQALASFAQLWSPRIVTRVNDYDVRISKVRGTHIWHRHDATDELFVVLDGALDIALREPAGERVVHLGLGDVFVVPRGMEHRPESRDGASLMVIEPSGTLSTGDQLDHVPDHIDSTIGHALELT